MRPSRAAWSSRKYRVLLASLLLLVVIRPLGLTGFVGSMAVDTTIAALVLLALALSGEGRIVTAAGTLLAGAIASAFALRMTWDTLPASRVLLAATSQVCTVAFLCLTCGTILSDVLAQPVITQDGLCGALSVYLLFGAVWASVYSLVFLLDPTSFAGARDAITAPRQPADLDECEAIFVYYSFVTLSTLGFGDIYPTSRLTRALSWMEAVLGQLYLAVLVARLVALQTNRAAQAAGGQEAGRR